MSWNDLEERILKYNVEICFSELESLSSYNLAGFHNTRSSLLTLPYEKSVLLFRYKLYAIHYDGYVLISEQVL